MEGIFLAFSWLPFLFPGTTLELFFSWEAFSFMAVFYLLVAFNSQFASPGKFVRQVYASLKKSRSRKGQRRLCDEVNEFRRLRAQEIFYETAQLISSHSGVEEKDPLVHYNLARAYSLFNKPEEALFHLRKAIESGYSDIAKVQKEADLASLRRSLEFQRFNKGSVRPKD